MTAATVEIENVPIDSLHPDPANPRRIGKEELEALTRSLREFGFVQPVLARKTDNVVIGGHQRLLAARRLGWKTVPAIFLDLSVEQSRLLNLALNRISGEWDQELLARMLADLKPVEDIDLSLSGFTEEELGKLLKSLDVREKTRPRGNVRPRRRFGSRTGGTRCPTWRSVAARGSPLALRRRDRRRGRVAVARRDKGGNGFHRPSLQRQPGRPRWSAAEGAGGAASPTTPCRLKRGRPLSAPGHRTSSRTSTAPSTSA